MYFNLQKILVFEVIFSKTFYVLKIYELMKCFKIKNNNQSLFSFNNLHNFIYLFHHLQMNVTNQRQRIQSLPYKKSNKFSRNRIIMNDLYVDCGYPQQIITHQSRPHSPQNYI